MVDDMVFLFLSGNCAVGDGQETDPCNAGSLSRACAYRPIPANPKRLMAASRTVNVTHLQTDVFITLRIILLFEGNMKERLYRTKEKRVGTGRCRPRRTERFISRPLY